MKKGRQEKGLKRGGGVARKGKEKGGDKKRIKKGSKEEKARTGTERYETKGNRMEGKRRNIKIKR